MGSYNVDCNLQLQNNSQSSKPHTRPDSSNLNVNKPGRPFKDAAAKAVLPSPSIDVTAADQEQIDAENRQHVQSMTAAEVRTADLLWHVIDQ